MQILVKHNIDQVLLGLREYPRKIRVATAIALTKSAKSAQAIIPDALERALDKPTAFTKRGTYIKPARASDLTARIGFKDRQASYLAYQIFGGTRTAGQQGLKLPAQIGLDVHGNIPRGVIKRLKAQAETGKGLTKRQGRRVGISNKSSLFYGQPDNPKLPPGIYRRGKGILIPLVVFPQRAAKYRQRFDFRRAVEQEVRKAYSGHFASALTQLLREGPRRA